MSSLWSRSSGALALAKTAAGVKRLPIEQIGQMESANLAEHGIKGTVDDWDRLYRSQPEHRQNKALDAVVGRSGVPGRLTVTPGHEMMVDGHHRYSAGKLHGLTHLPILDDPYDPEFNW